MELYSKRMGAVESSKHAAQRMTHDPSLQVGMLTPYHSIRPSDRINSCMHQGVKEQVHALNAHGCPMQDRPIQAEDGRIIFASTHVPNKQPRHGWTAIYSSKDGRSWPLQLSCHCIRAGRNNRETWLTLVFMAAVLSQSIGLDCHGTNARQAQIASQVYRPWDDAQAHCTRPSV